MSVKKIDQLLAVQRNARASDLHLTPGNPPLCRVNGEITPMRKQPLTIEEIQGLVDETLSDRHRLSLSENLDVDYAYEVAALSARFRVNVFYSFNGISAVFRLIPNEIPTLQQIGIPPMVLGLLQRRKGLVIVTGSTGSGKSTTLASMVDFINKTRKDHILTIEDPIEFLHPSQLSLINQREIGTHARTFASALRAALREDPDVILLGEMRDLETTELAITAAETGHLVLATLHTGNAARTVDRIISIFPSAQQSQIRTTLADSLSGVIAQNLVQTVDKKRIAAFEVMINAPSIANLIREAKSHQIQSIMQTGKGDGMIVMDDALRALYAAGLISATEVVKFGGPVLQPRP